jgi:hypothetical protein
MIGSYSFHTIVDRTGVMTSMSQNISGLAGAMLLIEGLVDRNLASSVVRSGNMNLKNRELQIRNLSNTMNSIHTPVVQGGSLPAGSQFSPSSSEK